MSCETWTALGLGQQSAALTITQSSCAVAPSPNVDDAARTINVVVARCKSSAAAHCLTDKKARAITHIVV